MGSVPTELFLFCQIFLQKHLLMHFWRPLSIGRDPKERESCVMVETLLLKIQVAGLAVDEGTLRDIDEDMSRRG